MGRAPCCDKANVKRGPWSPEEDATLKAYLQAHGSAGNWIALPTKAGLKRCGKSCRLRWLNYLRPDIKHGGFTDEEDQKICNLYNQMGSRWSVIASHLPGRTDNDVKNYWNTKLKKKLLAGKISLTTNDANTTSSATQIPTKNDNTVTTNYDPRNYNLIINNSCSSTVPKPLLEPDDSYPRADQRCLQQYDHNTSSRGLMDLLLELDDLVPKKSSHVSFLSQDYFGQLAASGHHTSEPTGDGFGGTAAIAEFEFGLPYDNNNNDHNNHGVVAPSYCMGTYFC